MKKLSLLFLLIIPFLYSLEPGNYIPQCIEEHYHIRGERIVYCYNRDTKVNNWSYYTLTKEQVEHQGFKRPTTYTKDPHVSSSAVTSDYTNSGYDRGHLAPSEDFDESELALKEANYMSNLSPQNPSFNRGIWSKVENRARTLAKEKDFVIIITGPLYEGNIKRIGANKVAVPASFWKIIIWEDGIECYNVPNEQSLQDISVFQVSLKSIETLAKIKVEK
jgi:endonuclease G